MIGHFNSEVQKEIVEALRILSRKTGVGNSEHRFAKGIPRTCPRKYWANSRAFFERRIKCVKTLFGC